MDDVTAAYIAGFFDGEGSVSFVWRKASKNGKLYGKIMARLSQNDRSVLEWVRDTLGYGSVHRNRARSGRCHDYVVAYESARKFLKTILPFLKVKRVAVLRKMALDAKHCRRQKRWGA